MEEPEEAWDPHLLHPSSIEDEEWEDCFLEERPVPFAHHNLPFGAPALSHATTSSFSLPSRLSLDSPLYSTPFSPSGEPTAITRSTHQPNDDQNVLAIQPTTDSLSPTLEELEEFSLSFFHEEEEPDLVIDLHPPPRSTPPTPHSHTTPWIHPPPPQPTRMEDEDASLLSRILQRAEVPSGPSVRVDPLRDQTRSHRPLPHGVQMIGKKRSRSWSAHRDVDWLLYKHVKRPKYKVEGMIDRVVREDREYPAPIFCFLQRHEESLEVTESALEIESAVSQSLLRTETILSHQQPTRSLIHPHYPHHHLLQEVTLSACSGSSSSSLDRMMIKQGLERFEILDLPRLHHRSMQFQQAMTGHWKPPEHLLISYFRAPVGEALDRILNHPALPEPIYQSYRHLASLFHTFCEKQGRSPHYQALLSRLQEMPLPRLQWNSVPGPQAITSLLQSFSRDPSLLDSDPSQTNHRETIPRPRENTSSTEEDTDSEMDECVEPPSDTLDETLYPYVAPLRHSTERVIHNRYAWCDLNCEVVDAWEYSLHQFLHKAIGKAFLLAKMRSNNSEAVVVTKQDVESALQFFMPQKPDMNLSPEEEFDDPQLSSEELSSLSPQVTNSSEDEVGTRSQV